MENRKTYRIGIIGFGPKGFYGFERLVAHLNQNTFYQLIEIHIFNTTEYFAAGDVYRTDQPEYLIMNYANRNINCWSLEEPISNVEETADFVSWLKINGYTNAAPGDYAPRKVVGDYLIHCFKRVVDSLPKNIKVITHIGSVVNVEKNEKSYLVMGSYRNMGNEFSVDCQNILFTTGHHSFKSQQTKIINNKNRIDFIYPVDEKLSSVTANSLVAVKGFGLTAIDAVLTLTEGRGGEFKKNDKGVLKYISSGKEPYKIYPFSRTGLPMVPRNGSPASEIELQYFSETIVENFKENRPISFNCTLLPLIKKEFYFAFYTALFNSHGHQLYFDQDFTVIENQVKFFHEDFPECPVFNWETIVDPFKDEPVLSSVVIQVYLEFLLEEAKRGEDKSPFMAAVAVWRKISPIFNELYSFGGLDAVSHKEFDTYYFGLFNRLSYGPPVKNLRKIVALCKAGLLDFSFAKSASFTENEECGSFSLKVENGQETSVDFYINATISRAKGKDFENELYQNLKRNKLIVEYENKLNTSYKPGCLALNDDGNPINENGQINPDITFYGTPTEGITFDNDTLSRTRNDFATGWAKQTTAAILKKDGSIDNYEREENVL